MNTPEEESKLDQRFLEQPDEESFDLQSDVDRIYSIGTKWRCMSLMKKIDPASHRVFEAAQSAAEIRHGFTRDKIDCLLSQTLTAHVRRFYQLQMKGSFVDNDPLEAFGGMIANWRINQVRSCVIATVQDELHGFVVGQQDDNQFTQIMDLQNKIAVIEENVGRGIDLPRSVLSKLDDLKRENEILLGEWVEAVSHQRPKVLDYLVRKAVSEPDDYLNLAALVVEGNTSSAQKVSSSAVQVLGLKEAANLFGLPYESLTKKVSARRTAAMNSGLRPELFARPITRPQDLWTDIEVRKGG